MTRLSSRKLSLEKIIACERIYTALSAIEVNQTTMPMMIASQKTIEPMRIHRAMPTSLFLGALSRFIRLSCGANT